MYFFQRPPINSRVTKPNLCNRTHKAPCHQALENVPTTHPQPITKKLQLPSMPTGKDPASGFSLSNTCTQFVNSRVAYITWRGYAPTFSQVDCPQFDYFPQLAASWIAQCVPHRSGSSVRREKSMSQTEEKKRLIFCFCLIFSSTHFQFPFLFCTSPCLCLSSTLTM